ncbi:RxLR effector protein [Phytophthora megakarya]|uniref:RxLR effector protein n=1 Tax=Phytophthora megakarya TaxID=4795 RepID=A0A225UQA7_9STRA|nr:RxLR effector protein [Phytophthora megakarya]
MRSLFWGFLWVLIYLSAYTEVTLATGSEKLSTLNSVKSTPVSFSKNLRTVSRFLRRDNVGLTKAATDDDNVGNEERSVVADKLKGGAIKVVESVYKGAGKLVGQDKVDKLRTKNRQHIAKIYHKTNANPEYFLNKANKETNPILKARFVEYDRLVKALRESKQKRHRS